MKIDIPEGLVEFSRDFSRFKTPEERTQGWPEEEGEVRGEGDVLDTVGSLMLWRYLAEKDVPVTYLLTGRQGDEADLLVNFKHPEGQPRSLSVNVKTSKYEWKNDTEPCTKGHLNIKEVEFEKGVFDLYAQVFVHLSPRDEHGTPHVHLCGWVGKRDDVFERQEIRSIPGTPDVPGYTIPCQDLKPMEELLRYVKPRR